MIVNPNASLGKVWGAKVSRITICYRNKILSLACTWNRKVFQIKLSKKLRSLEFLKPKIRLFRSILSIQWSLKKPVSKMYRSWPRSRFRGLLRFVGIIHLKCLLEIIDLLKRNLNRVLKKGIQADWLINLSSFLNLMANLWTFFSFSLLLRTLSLKELASRLSKCTKNSFSSFLSLSTIKTRMESCAN